MNNPTKYSDGIVILHWLVAACLVFVLVLAWYLAQLDESPLKEALLTSHKSVGLTVFGLLLVRIYWRVRHPVPKLLPAQPLLRIGATFTHVLFYAVLIGMAVSGYISVASRGQETVFFYLFQLPKLSPFSRDWSRLATRWHDLSQYMLYALLVLHLSAVLYHELILRDRVLDRIVRHGWIAALNALRQRMLP